MVDGRRTARAAVAQCGHLPCVPDRGTSLIAPETDPRRAWVVQFVVDVSQRRSDAVPSSVLGVLDAHGLALVDAERRGTPTHRVVTAEVERA